MSFTVIFWVTVRTYTKKNGWNEWLNDDYQKLNEFICSLVGIGLT